MVAVAQENLQVDPANYETASVEALQGRLLTMLSSLEAELAKTTNPQRRAYLMARISYVKEVLAKLLCMVKKGVSTIRRRSGQCWLLLILALYARSAAIAASHSANNRARSAENLPRHSFNRKSRQYDELRLAA